MDLEDLKGCFVFYREGYIFTKAGKWLIKMLSSHSFPIILLLQC